MSDHFDLIVIGAGPAGEVLAGEAAAAGFSTAIIEKELAGGECSYWACIPSKTLLHSGAVLERAKSAPGVTGNLDSAAVLTARNDNVSNYEDSSQVEWINSSGITFFRGLARIEAERTVSIADRSLVADKAVVVASGSVPVIPPIPGLKEIDFWDSRRATSTTVIPEHLAIIGGGVVAVEMAEAFCSLGSTVTMIVRGDRLLEREEPFVGEELAKSFAEKGISVRFGASVTEVRADVEGAVLYLHDGSELRTSTVLVATGRRPATDELGVESLGLEAGKAIKVDDQLRATSVPGDWLYAIGDVNGRSLLTHMGKYQARILVRVLKGEDATAWADHTALPRVVFTHLQIAAVGLTLAAAKDAGIEAEELKVPLASTAGAMVVSTRAGTAQLVIDRKRQIVVGATFTGPDAGEMLQSATNAIVGEIEMDRLWHAVPAFPTVSEVWLRLLESSR